MHQLGRKKILFECKCIKQYENAQPISLPKNRYPQDLLNAEKNTIIVGASIFSYDIGENPI